jgi:uncharacterized protein YebE (UPF0316 family)
MHTARPWLIAALVLTEVALWQWRLVIAHRGRRIAAALLGFLGATLQITAISQVVTNVHDVLSIVAYAGGVGFGVLLGIVAGERLTPGRQEVTIVSSLPDLAERLWRQGWPATAQEARAEGGPIVSVHVEIDRRHEARLWDAAATIDPQVRWAVREVRTHPLAESAHEDGPRQATASRERIQNL